MTLPTHCAFRRAVAVVSRHQLLPRHVRGSSCSAPPSPSSYPRRIRRHRALSTAAATASAARHDDEHDGGMPRLRALRERLRLEAHRGGGGGDDVVAVSTNHQPFGSTVRRHSSDDGGMITIATEGEGMINDIDDIDEYANPIVGGKVMRDGNILTDSHGRHHNYLRISLSERCNLRCQYCMPPEGVALSHHEKLLTDDEIVRLVRVFVNNGVNKVRLTGGEPLLRPNLARLVLDISDALRRGVVDDVNGGGTMGGGSVGMTTNGISLSRHIDDLVDAGLTGVNISLDTLRHDKFQEITRRNGLDKVMRSIGDAVRAFRDRYGDVRYVGRDGVSGPSRVKINCVVMRDVNDDELSDFVRMADETYGGDVDMRFIEWMPFNDNGWNASRFVSYGDMMDKLSDDGMSLERIGDGPNDTTKWWRVRRIDTAAGSREGNNDGGSTSATRVGFITSMSEHFCSSCNRLRITADGKIKVCLFGSNEREVSLRDIMREHPQHHEEEGSIPRREEALERMIHAAVQRKTFALGGHGSAENIAKAADNRPMTLIGG